MCRAFIRSLALSGVCCFLALTPAQADWGDEGFSSDFDRTWLEDAGGELKTTAGLWTLSLHGGTSRIDDFRSSMTTQDVSTEIQVADVLYTLNFPGRTLTVDDVDSGYSLGAGLYREMTSWLTAGVEGGASLAHTQIVERNDIPFYDGTVSPPVTGLIPYTIDYKVYVLHILPVLQMGPWIPMGQVALRPYVTGGAGWHQIQEKTVFFATGADFLLGRRSTSAFGVLYGAGLDLRISQSGLIGLKYQAQTVNRDPESIRLSNLMARFSYLF